MGISESWCTDGTCFLLVFMAMWWEGNMKGTLSKAPYTWAYSVCKYKRDICSVTESSPICRQTSKEFEAQFDQIHEILSVALGVTVLQDTPFYKVTCGPYVVLLWSFHTHGYQYAVQCYVLPVFLVMQHVPLLHISTVLPQILHEIGRHCRPQNFTVPGLVDMEIGLVTKLECCKIGGSVR